MRDESILEVGIDPGGRFFVRPAETSFDQIFRTAMGVAWDEQKSAIVIREQGDWTLGRWFEQILAAASDEYGVALRLTPSTEWTGVPAEIQRDILTFSDSDWLNQLLARGKEADERYWRDFELEQAFADADSHWAAGRYSDYVRIVAPHRDRLSRAQLKRLAIAEKRLSD